MSLSRRGFLRSLGGAMLGFGMACRSLAVLGYEPVVDDDVDDWTYTIAEWHGVSPEDFDEFVKIEVAMRSDVFSK